MLKKTSLKQPYIYAAIKQKHTKASVKKVYLQKEIQLELKKLRERRREARKDVGGGFRFVF